MYEPHCCIEARASVREQQISFQPLKQPEVVIPILTSLPEQRPTQRVWNFWASDRILQNSGLLALGQQKSRYWLILLHTPLPNVRQESTVPAGQLAWQVWFPLGPPKPCPEHVSAISIQSVHWHSDNGSLGSGLSCADISSCLVLADRALIALPDLSRSAAQMLRP